MITDTFFEVTFLNVTGEVEARIISTPNPVRVQALEFALSTLPAVVWIDAEYLLST